MIDRSSLREVRNPVLALPSDKAILALPLDQRTLIADLFGDLALDARQRAEKCWRTHKGPMALYWKTTSVVAGHIRRMLRK